MYFEIESFDLDLSSRYQLALQKRIEFLVEKIFIPDITKILQVLSGLYSNLLYNHFLFQKLNSIVTVV